MVDQKKFFWAALSLTVALTWSFLPRSLYASQKSYYDFGPYYSQTHVLGISFSALENLPALKLPDNLVPPPATGILPGSPFYFFEQATENIQLVFTPDPVKKEELRLGFAQERLSEAKTLMEQGKTEAASSAMSDYGKAISAAAQTLSNLAEKNDPSVQTLADKVEEAASAQAVVTQALALGSPPAQAEIWTAGVAATRTALDQVADTKGASPVPEELSNGIQKLKEQGLISEEESNKLYSFKSRSQVRDELDKLVSSGQFPLAEIAKLDEGVARRYPDIQEQQVANLQVAELKTYQTLPQPSKEALDEIEKWQNNPGIPPSNDIKPYLWYDRAQGLAREVNLSNFSQEQQSDVARFYPVITNNPTYQAPLPSPPPAGGPEPTTTSQSQITTEQQTTDQTATQSVAQSPEPSPAPPPAQPYLGDTGGALPGQPFYFFKQAGEQLAFTFTFDPARKAELKMQHAERRLAEAAQLANDPEKA
ncbi:MAG: hypothetical protein HYS83_00005, partial [Candidatus Blackburnbacteria bacterium]|nr:hypothetical protein [Candidatus Blackburnbacteria bacterium]